MSDNLKLCPFCGGSNIRIEKIYDYYEVICCDCLSRTEEYPTKEQAIETWNKRPSPWHIGIPTEEGLYLCKVIGLEVDDEDKFIPYYIFVYKNNEFKTTITDFVVPKEHIMKWQKIEED